MHEQKKQRDAMLALEDGSLFKGFSFGAKATVEGEAFLIRQSPDIRKL